MLTLIPSGVDRRHTQLVKVWLVLGTALLVCSTALALDVDQFPLSTLKNFQRHRTLPTDATHVIIDPSTTGLSVVVRNSGAVREIPQPKRFFMETFLKAMPNSTELLKLYRKEIRVVEQGRSYWVPVQQTVLPRLLREVPANTEFTVYTRYLGSVGEVGRLYVAIDFDARVRSRVPKTTCFTNELAGVRLGQPITAVRARLTKRYGKPFREERAGARQYSAFGLDPEYRTQLIIMDAGAGYRKRVFSVQVTGPPNPRLSLYNTLRLGAKPSELARVLGKPVRQADTEKGYRLYRYANSPCSVEVKNGVLASVLISQDPNYFSE